MADLIGTVEFTAATTDLDNAGDLQGIALLDSVVVELIRMRVGVSDPRSAG